MLEEDKYLDIEEKQQAIRELSEESRYWICPVCLGEYETLDRATDCCHSDCIEQEDSDAKDFWQRLREEE